MATENHDQYFKDFVNRNRALNIARGKVSKEDTSVYNECISSYQPYLTHPKDFLSNNAQLFADRINARVKEIASVEVAGGLDPDSDNYFVRLNAIFKMVLKEELEGILDDIVYENHVKSTFEPWIATLVGNSDDLGENFALQQVKAQAILEYKKVAVDLFKASVNKKGLDSAISGLQASLEQLTEIPAKIDSLLNKDFYKDTVKPKLAAEVEVRSLETKQKAFILSHAEGKAKQNITALKGKSDLSAEVRMIVDKESFYLLKVLPLVAKAIQNHPYINMVQKLDANRKFKEEIYRVVLSNCRANLDEMFENETGINKEIENYVQNAFNNQLILEFSNDLKGIQADLLAGLKEAGITYRFNDDGTLASDSYESKVVADCTKYNDIHSSLHQLTYLKVNTPPEATASSGTTALAVVPAADKIQNSVLSKIVTLVTTHQSSRLNFWDHLLILIGLKQNKAEVCKTAAKQLDSSVTFAPPPGAKFVPTAA